MIIKFAKRGKGVGSGPVDYLLGEDRDREGATLNRGDPDQVQALIDSSPYAKRYTTGYLSFAEKDLSTEVKQRLMTEFEKALLPGLDSDQYSIMWVEHVDKGRLELNFVVPNVELLTGKRLQPYFHRADNPRLDAWRTIQNIELGLHDPDDPANRQALVQASNLPPDIRKVGELITDGLLHMAKSGLIRDREDVITALESGGYEIARVTPSSISLKNPNGNRNIRLKGFIYEREFRVGNGLQSELEEAIRGYRETAPERLREAYATYSRCFEGKRTQNNKRYKRPESTINQSGAPNMDLGTPDGEHCLDGLLGRDLVAGAGHSRQPASAEGASRRLSPATGGDRTQPEPTRAEPTTAQGQQGRGRGGRESTPNGEHSTRIRRERFRDDGGTGDPTAGVGYHSQGGEPGTLHRHSHGLQPDIRQLESRPTTRVQATGEQLDDPIRNRAIQIVREITATTSATTQRITEELQRVTEDVRDYLNGERPIARSGSQLEQAGSQLERTGREFGATATAIRDALQSEQRLEIRSPDPDIDYGFSP